MVRVTGKQFLLTYTKVHVQPEIIPYLEHRFSRTIPRWTIGWEQHADGSPHSHVVIQFNERIDTTDILSFDYLGTHPNVKYLKGATSLQRAEDYAKKEGHYRQTGADDTAAISRRERIYGRALACTSSADAHKVLQENAPRDYVLYNTAICKFIDSRFIVKTPYVSEYKLEDFKLGFNILNWIANNVWNLVAPTGTALTAGLHLDLPTREVASSTIYDELVTPEVTPDPTRRRFSMALIGPSRTGKTEMARSIGSHWYNITFFMLDNYDATCEYAIFDDVEITKSNFNLYKPFFGCQATINVTDKYRHKQQIKWGKPSIFLFNDDEFDDLQNSLSKGQKDWLKANCEMYRVNKLY
uniref:Replication-associated protein n=1 Tax=Red panda feces-associated circular DNA virus 13 TaxID=2863966 RepID=A0A8K1M404_9VIRU|nr:replication-associated protein [Red panda feces-associated circular DNA virus 13]